MNLTFRFSQDAYANFLSCIEQHGKKAAQCLSKAEKSFQSYSDIEKKIGDRTCQKRKNLGSQWGVVMAKL